MILVEVTVVIVCPFVVSVSVILLFLLLWFPFPLVIVPSPHLCHTTCLFPPCKHSSVCVCVLSWHCLMVNNIDKT